MHCPQCDYEIPAGQDDCPRCRFREAVRGAAEPPALPAAAVPAPLPDTARIAARKSQPWKRNLVGAFSFALPAALLLGWYVHSQALTPTERKIAVIFAASDGPCRHGMATPCFDSIYRIRRLNDYPDASLLLGDYKVARYLPTLPGGMALTRRWQQDAITEPELRTMGDVAYAKNLTVCRSFWMYAQIKNDHTTVPQFIIGGAGGKPMPRPRSQ